MIETVVRAPHVIPQKSKEASESDDMHGVHYWAF